MPGSMTLPEKHGKKAEHLAQARPQSPAEAGQQEGGGTGQGPLQERSSIVG